MSYLNFRAQDGSYLPIKKPSYSNGSGRPLSTTAPAPTNPAHPAPMHPTPINPAPTNPKHPTPTNPAYSPPTNPAYQAPSSQGPSNWQQYNSAAYAWQNYYNGSENHQSVHDYHGQQTHYHAPTTTSYHHHGWYGPDRQPQAQSDTQALRNLAYVSGQAQQARNDLKFPHSHTGPQLLNLDQREEQVQGRAEFSYSRGRTPPAAKTSQISQTEQSPHASPKKLAISAAAAVAETANHRNNNSRQKSALSTQQHQVPAPSAATAGTHHATTMSANQIHQWPALSYDANAHGQPQGQYQLPSSDLTQSSHNVNRYGTPENGRTKDPNATLQFPSATPILLQKPSSGAMLRSSDDNTGAGRLLGNPDMDSGGISTSSNRGPSNATARQDFHEPAAPMPTFIDPSQVYNPYHREHERQDREEGERAKRASIVPPVVTIGTNDNGTDTNQPEKVALADVTGSMQQAPRSAGTNMDVSPSPPPVPTAAEPKLSEDVDMANDMKAMMMRLREWKTKDPSLFQKLWDDMKKGGSGTQPTKRQTLSQSPQLAQASPKVLQSQSPQLSQQHQSAELQSTTAPETLAPSNRPPSRTTSNRPPSRTTSNQDPPRTISETSSNPKRDVAATVPVENDKERLPDPGRSVLRQSATQDTTLVSPAPGIPQPPPANSAPMIAASKQTTAPPSGANVWPEAKRKALAETAQNVLMGLPANQGKVITAAEIHDLLEQNPSYIELCAELEKRGFVFHRGRFARTLLHTVPDLVSPSHIQNKSTPQLAASLPPAQPVKQVAANEVTGRIPNSKSRIQNGCPSPRAPSYHQFPLQPASEPKASRPIPPANARQGVPSPNIPAPIPGPKEAKARKRDFSELVDLTQLSDDEDYSMPRKQARHGGSPHTRELQVRSGFSETGTPSQLSDMARLQGPYGFSTGIPPGPPGSSASNVLYPQAQYLVSQPRSQAPTPPPQRLPQTSHHLLAKPLKKAEALRKSYYNPKTVARDILIAAGRHPTEQPLNAHLAGLLGKYINLDSDLSTFDWDAVDPGGPPMPVVQVVDIPAGPPKWKLGQRPNGRGPTTGTNRPPWKAGPIARVKLSGPGPTVGKGILAEKESNAQQQENGQSSLERLSAQTKLMLEESIKMRQAKKLSSTRLRQTQNVNQHSKSSSPTVNHQEITPRRTQSPTTSIMPSTFPPRPRGRPRKSSVVVQVTHKRPRGRPPGSGKSVEKSSGNKVSVTAQTRSVSPLQFNIYACRWRGCDAKLHNLPTLRKHIAKVHKITDEESKTKGQPCLWEQCRTLPPTTATDNISKVTFNSTSDWLDHIDSDHLHPLGMKLGDGPSSAQTGKPKPFEVAKYIYHPPSIVHPLSSRSRAAARTCSHTDPQILDRERQSYLVDDRGRTVTAPSTNATISNYHPDTMTLSSVAEYPESNVPTKAFSKAHGNGEMSIKKSAIQKFEALVTHKEGIGPGLDRGGCTLVNAERRATLLDHEGMARVVEGDY